MSDESKAFSVRLKDAMQAAGYEPRPSQLVAHFNSRYRGASVTFQSASRWLTGKSIPEQDKLQVLAQLYGVEPHVLRFGGKRLGEGRASWSDAMNAQDRAMVDAFLHLPMPQRKLVRELVAALAAGVRS